MLELLADSSGAFVTLALVLGLLVGSFLNVVIYRLPIMLERQWRAECAGAAAQDDAAAADAREAADLDWMPVPTQAFNLVVPRSACPQCRAPITALQNVPVISWLVLRRRCASCAARISPRYPAIELLTGVASAVVAWHTGFGWPAACAVVITWFLIALTFIDLDHQLLPDSLTLPLLWMGLLASLSGWDSPQQALPVDPASAILGAAAGYLSLWSIYHLFRLLTGKEGMGYGDFKLLAALGAWLGWRMLLPIVLLSACAGALIGILLIITRRHQRGNPMPFGPFLAIAGWVAMLWGPQLVSSYLGLYISTPGR
ncbi:MAG TPA: A24 family peptidase [Steroidobacteraceae bacterium]|nr:A24 family peptidase [Steroidobacteraceae bacterium]